MTMNSSHLPFINRILRFFVVLAMVCVASATQAEPIVIDAIDSGNYVETGRHISSDEQYRVKSAVPGQRNFFVFNLQGGAGEITSATLRLYTGSVQGSGLFRLFDVQTDIDVLRSGQTDRQDIYSDLGGGTELARIRISTGQHGQIIDIPLNAAAINLLNSASGQIAFGGSIGTLISTQTVAFGGTGSGSTRQLILETEDIPTFPMISVSPDSHDFGDVGVGGASSPVEFTISNLGEGNLEVNTPTLYEGNQSDFNLQNSTCPTAPDTVPPQGSCSFEAVFSPSSAGLKETHIKIKSNDPNNEDYPPIPLSGQGVIEHALTLLKQGDGDGTIGADDNTEPVPPCLPGCSEFTEQYPENQVVTLTASAESTSTFEGWSGDADCSDGQVTMTQDITCTATFELAKKKELTACEVDLPDTITVTRAEKAEIKATAILTPSDANNVNTEWIFIGGKGGRKTTKKKFSTDVILVDGENTYEVEVRIYSDGNTVLCSDKAKFNVEARSGGEWKTIPTLKEDAESKFGNEPTTDDGNTGNLKILGQLRDRESDTSAIIVPNAWSKSPSKSAYTVDQVKDENGPNDKYWYIKESRMRIDQETVINQWLKPDKKMTGKDKGKQNWFNYNRDFCQPNNGFSPGAFLEALKGHENSGVAGKVSTGHYRLITDELAKTGMNPGLKIENIFSSDTTNVGFLDITEDANREVLNIDSKLHTVSDHEHSEGVKIEDYGNWEKSFPDASLRNSNGNYSTVCIYLDYYL